MNPKLTPYMFTVLFRTMLVSCCWIVLCSNQISVILPDTRTIQLTVQNSTTILQVKTQIQTSENIPTGNQKLYYNGNFLGDDTKSLSYYGIPNMATLNLLLASVPVKLQSFGIREGSGGRLELEWVSAQEQQVKEYQVEHSMDQLHWEELAAVKAAGNSPVPRRYAYTFENGRPGAHYFRLRMVDLDGSWVMSAIVREILGDWRVTAPYPNPFVEQLTVVPGGRVLIYDGNGKQVAVGGMEGKETIWTGSWRPGVYSWKRFDAAGRLVASGKLVRRPG